MKYLPIGVMVAGLGACNAPIKLESGSFDWLAGCWRLERADGAYEELWLTAPDGAIGASREVRAKRTVAYEFLRIELRPDGSMVYIAHPSAQARIEFGLTGHGPGRLVFENPQHDFPTRIEYRYVDLNAITARIEGAPGGKARAIDYPMRRIECEGA